MIEIKVVAIHEVDEKPFQTPLGFCSNVIYEDENGNKHNTYISSRLKRNLENTFLWKRKKGNEGKLFITLNKEGRVEFEISYA